VVKLWKVWQTQNNGYDTFNAMIVAAETEDGARLIHPMTEDETPESHADLHIDPLNPWERWARYDGWALSPDAVSVQLIGEAVDGVAPGVVLTSFNAG